MTLHKDTIFAELCSLSADQMEDMIEVLHNSRIPIYAPALLSWAEDALLELRDEENEEWKIQFGFLVLVDITN